MQTIKLDLTKEELEAMSLLLGLGQDVIESSQIKVPERAARKALEKWRLAINS